MNLSLCLSNPALSVKKHVNGRLRGTEENKKVLSLFLLLQELIIPQSLFCLKCTSPKLLHFFCSRLTYPQAHTVWLAVSSPTLAPPRVLWLALLFLAPGTTSLLSFLLLSLLQIARSSQCAFREPLGPDRTSAEDLLQTKPHTPLLNWNLKVDQRPSCFCDFFFYVCGYMWGSFISADMGSNNVGCSWAYPVGRLVILCSQHTRFLLQLRKHICWTWQFLHVITADDQDLGLLNAFSMCSIAKET